MNLVRLQYGGGGGELHGASITVNTEESTLVGKEALLYKVSDLSTIINRAVYSALSSDGVSTATFNNIIEPDTYIVKSSNGTEEGNTDNIEITSDDIINKTTLVRSLYLGLKLNVTFYSASGETIKYKRQNSDELILLGKADNTGKGNGTIICKDGETITFSGDIAKDEANNTYSKSIILTKDTTEIYVMPDGKVIYWYGYGSDNMTGMNETNGGMFYKLTNKLHYSAANNPNISYCFSSFTSVNKYNLTPYSKIHSINSLSNIIGYGGAQMINIAQGNPCDISNVSGDYYVVKLNQYNACDLYAIWLE